MGVNGTNGVGEAAVQLPIIDISDPTPETARLMIDAAVKFGFLYIDTKGTDFTEEIVDREFDLVRLLGVQYRRGLCCANEVSLVQEILLVSRIRKGRVSDRCRCTSLIALLESCVTPNTSGY